jgi:hypothetical protein
MTTEGENSGFLAFILHLVIHKFTLRALGEKSAQIYILCSHGQDEHPWKRAFAFASFIFFCKMRQNP